MKYYTSKPKMLRYTWKTWIYYNLNEFFLIFQQSNRTLQQKINYFPQPKLPIFDQNQVFSSESFLNWSIFQENGKTGASVILLVFVVC